MRRFGWRLAGTGAGLILLAAAVPTLAAQQKLEDVAPFPLTPKSLYDLPLDAALRANLQNALQARDYSRAIKLLVAKIDSNPSSPHLLALLGNVYFLSGRYVESAMALKEADAQSPLNSRNRFLLAMAFIALEKGGLARPELEALARSEPQIALYPYWLARVDYDEMQLTSAVRNLNKAIELDPNFIKAYDNLGLCYEALGKSDEAIAAYERAVRLNQEKQQQSPWPAMNLGALLLKLGRLDEAERYLRESLKEDPRFPKARFQLGLLFEKRGQDDQAVEELTQAADLDPTYPNPHFVLARIYRRKNDAESARKALETFEKLTKKEKEINVRRPR